MNTQKYVIASIAAAVWLFVYGFVANVYVLAEYWATNTTLGLMRPEGGEIMWAVVVSMLLQGFALGYIFTRNFEGTGLGEGVRFGLLITWFIAGLYFLFYALQPWELTSTFVAIITDGVGYIGAGVVLALIYKK